jgi:tRNA dimethylallyltransferase
MMPVKTAIIIMGPTAAGKTALSLAVARHFSTSIISADSRQCFRELNIGVAKPDASELAEVKHEFINSHSILEDVHAALYESLALSWANTIFEQKDVVVVAGGTGLYIQAFCEGLDPVPPADEQLRIEIREQYDRHGLVWLQEKIRLLDPEFDRAGETRNPQRMMRALEVVESTGRSILSFRHTEKKARPFRIVRFGIRLPMPVLYARINTRVDRMMEAGLLEEVRSLLAHQHRNALQTVGYTELFEHLNGECSLDEAVNRIKQNSRHYAKRQMTWLRKETSSIHWLGEDPMREIRAAL